MKGRSALMTIAPAVLVAACHGPYPTPEPPHEAVDITVYGPEFATLREPTKEEHERFGSGPPFSIEILGIRRGMYDHEHFLDLAIHADDLIAAVDAEFLHGFFEYSPNELIEIREIEERLLNARGLLEESSGRRIHVDDLGYWHRHFDRRFIMSDIDGTRVGVISAMLTCRLPDDAYFVKIRGEALLDHVADFNTYMAERDIPMAIKVDPQSPAFHQAYVQVHR